ncbi:phage tail tape measure protein [Pantoea sp. SORGH_AS_0659]|uniref:phage tail tape measure protein n=1 Tax=Pantoea sp. SORGH_AS_0659 TaxID=3062597 RepID=UPI0028545C5C|nr:phage tail tape measure protein [Pantoea sp. SORGH_AS_0659]MDR6350832.1 TP901 family phage tail tape measure protein [Pantoea sp. SORGH_AS_0659]
MADSFQLKAIITAVDQLSGPLKGMSKNLKGFQKEAKDIMVSAAAVGVALTSAFSVPISQAMDFESQMADVRKVVNFDTPQQFKEMGEDVLKLSTQLPMAANGIAQIVAAGGQSGIARKDLMQFASDAVKMGVAFDQTAEESGQMMAQWRTAFKLTQSDVVVLADKINYLGNTGPANAQKISDIVTRIGPLGGVAGVASGEIAAMGATIAGMGVESEIAATGIKNFMLSLTSGKSATSSQKKALKFIKIDPARLAADMQKDSRAAMLKVLDSLAKVPKDKQAAVMNALFGKESLAAIAPLLTNLDLLRTNFTRVADAQQYAGSMQKEYESRAATTANSVQLLKNQFSAASITIGEMFLPDIVKLTQKIQPMIEQFRQFTKANPEMVRGTFKFGIALLGTASAMGVASRAVKIFDSVMKMSTMGKVISLLVLGGSLIISNWDQIAPVVKSVWKYVNEVVEAMGGWETVLAAVSTLMVGAFADNTVGTLESALSTASSLSEVLGQIASLGALTVSIGVAIYVFKKLNDIADSVTKKDGTTSFWESLKNRWNAGGWYNNQQEGPGYQSAVPLSRPEQGELKVTFDNAPPGMRVAPAGNALPWLNYDVGYNRFSGNN